MSRYSEVELENKIYLCEWSYFLEGVPASFYGPGVDDELVNFKATGPEGEKVDLKTEEDLYLICLERVKTERYK